MRAYVCVSKISIFKDILSKKMAILHLDCDSKLILRLDKHSIVPKVIKKKNLSIH